MESFIYTLYQATSVDRNDDIDHAHHFYLLHLHLIPVLSFFTICLFVIAHH